MSAGAHHASLGFLVSGGYHPGSLFVAPYRLSSTELSTDGAIWGPYTPLPIGLSSHCVVALDSNYGDFFLVGGWDGSNERTEAYIHRNGNWVGVTPMQTARNGKRSNKEEHVIQTVCFCITGHMCGPVRMSPGGSVEQIVVAGGYGGSFYLGSVEVYDISSNTWAPGVGIKKLNLSLTS